MSKLMDVCGLVDYNSKTREHNRTKSIYGSLLVDEQSDYFEGFVRTYDESNSFLVFGTFNDEEGLHMYSCSEDMQEPKEIFLEASKENKTDLSRKNQQFFRYSIPGLSVFIQDGDVFREVTNGETSILRTKIDFLKNRYNLVTKSPQKIKK